MARKVARLEELLREARQSSAVAHEPDTTCENDSSSKQKANQYDVALREGRIASSTFETNFSHENTVSAMGIERLDQSCSPNDGSTTLISLSRSVTAEMPWDSRNPEPQPPLGGESTSRSFPAPESLVGSAPEDQEGSSMYSAANVRRCQILSIRMC